MTIRKALKISLVLGTLIAAGCGADRARDQAVCSGTVCAFGRCVEQDGEPVCECTAADQALGFTCEPVPPDEPDTADRAMRVPSDGVARIGYFELRDEDYFRLLAVERHIYTVTCDGLELSCDRFYVDPPVAELSADSREITFIAGASGYVTLGFRPAEGRTSVYFHAFFDRGLELPSDPAAGPVVELPFQSSLEIANDIDAFRFELEAGRSIGLGLSLSGESTDLDDARLFGPDGRLLGHLVWPGRFDFLTGAGGLFSVSLQGRKGLGYGVAVVRDEPAQP